MRTAIRAFVILAIVLAHAGPASPAAEAQSDTRSWPQRNVRLILPFGAGSSTDVTARLLAERLQAKWGNAVVIENRPGGDGLLSITSFVSARDDHVLYFSPTSVFIVHPYQHATLPYDPEQDLVPVARLSKSLLVWAAPAVLAAANLKEFVALVRASPGTMNFAVTPGFTEFVFTGFLREQGLEMSKVPYRDIVQAPNDLAENRIQVLGVSHTVASPQVQAGRVKLLAVADRRRSALEPNVMSVHEAGFPSLESVSQIGVFGPRGIALELRERIAQDFIALVNEPAIAEKIGLAAQTIDTGGPEEFTASIAEQRVRVAGIAQLLGMTGKK